MTTDMWTGRPLDKPSDNLPKTTREKCEACGHPIVDRCYYCGAPQCCPKCCERDSREEARAAAIEQRWMIRNEQNGEPYGTY